MKRLILAAAPALTLFLVAAPVAAEKSDGGAPSAEEVEAMTILLADMFGDAEPLTAEQETRLPAAIQVVSSLMPDGAMVQMLDESLVGAIMDDTSGTPAFAVADLTGIDPLELAAVGDKNLEEALSLLDPDYAERSAAMNSAFLELLTEIMIEVEPAYQAGLARAYAVRFTKSELLELAAYFQTPVGSKYATESLSIDYDPHVMSAMSAVLPAVLERMPAITEAVEQTSEKYPDGRSFSDLSEGERGRLALLLGVDEAELEASAPASAEGEVEDALEGA
jgi:hypothetical protein